MDDDGYPFRMFFVKYDNEPMRGRMYLEGDISLSCDAISPKRFSLAIDEVQEFMHLFFNAPITDKNTGKRPLWEFLNRVANHYYQHQQEYHPDGYYSDYE